jgi:enamine deaminase RidA (YjgF/YER057c/UK114 family)
MERVNSDSPFERMASYSRAVRSGNTVAVSGTASTDEAGAARFRGDAYRQTRDAFERALEAAARLGAARDQVVRTRIFLAPGADWREAVRAHGDVFRGVDPANTTLFVAGLIPEGSLSEIELDAAIE